MRIHYLLDFTKGDHINIRICAVHAYEIEPIDLDCKYVYSAIVSGTEDGNIITFWKWTEKGRIKIIERKVKGYLKLKRVKRIDILTTKDELLGGKKNTI